MTEEGLLDFSIPKSRILRGTINGMPQPSFISIKCDDQDYSGIYPERMWQPISDIADNTKYCPTCGQRLP